MGTEMYWKVVFFSHIIRNKENVKFEQTLFLCIWATFSASKLTNKSIKTPSIHVCIAYIICNMKPDLVPLKFCPFGHWISRIHLFDSTNRGVRNSSWLAAVNQLSTKGLEGYNSHSLEWIFMLLGSFEKHIFHMMSFQLSVRKSFENFRFMSFISLSFVVIFVSICE